MPDQTGRVAIVTGANSGPFTQDDPLRAQRKQIDDELAALDELAQSIGAEWSSPQSGAEILEELRKERGASLITTLTP
jgi:hypothetical protein